LPLAGRRGLVDRRGLQGLRGQLALDRLDALARQVGDVAFRFLAQVGLVVFERLFPVAGEQIRLGDVEQQPRARLQLVREQVLANGLLVLVALVVGAAALVVPARGLLLIATLPLGSAVPATASVAKIDRLDRLDRRGRIWSWLPGRRALERLERP
jgi:hypothetical protein